MISLIDVTKQYNLDNNTVVTPVRDANLDVERGELIMVVGRSGSGKTTLLSLVAGLTRPDTGKILIEGVNLQDMNDRQLSLLRNQKIGFVFQSPGLLPSLNVLENVLLPTVFGNSGEKNKDRRAEQLLETVGLLKRMSAYPKQLSAGEQKRVMVARSLMNQPEILLADEPTGDLDEHTEKDIMNLLEKTNTSGVTVLMATHSVELVSYASRVFRMDNGKLLEINKQ